MENSDAAQLHLDSLPLDRSPRTTESIGPEDGDDYYVTLRYLDSAPVVLALATERFVAGRGMVKSFRSDGRFLWDDVEHDAALSSTVRFKRQLVMRAKDHDGVCPILGEETRRDLVQAIANVLN